jgi:C4-dicarboxylate-binding protein DctP
MKTAFRIGLAGAALLCSLGAWAADYTMRISHQFPPTHQTARALDQFAADVKASTGGKIEVQIFGAEQLFKANQQHAAVARGQVEAAAIVSFGWGGTIPEMNVMTIPFLMTHAGQLKKFPTSDAARLLDEKMAAKGVKNIAWLVDANDAIVTSAKAPLLKPEDFKGVKIRGISKLFDNGLTAMGASPSAMPGSEVYQALQTGVIDAGITSCAAAYSRRYYEVQKFGVASAMLTAYETLVVNPAWWEKLPTDLQKNLMAAAHKAEATLLPTSDEVAPEDVKRLRDKGMQVTVLTKEQEKALAAVMQPPVIKAFGESSPDGAKLIGMIQKL